MSNGKQCNLRRGRRLNSRKRVYLRVKVWQKYRNRPGHGGTVDCNWCGIHLRKREMTVDHLTDLADGGTNDIENLVPACNECNQRRSVRLHNDSAGGNKGESR